MSNKGHEIRKSIWIDDRVKVITGEYQGLEGVVTKRQPSRGYLAHFVWVRFDGVKGGVSGPRLHVKNVQITEMSRAHRKARRDEARRAARATQKKASR